MTSRGKQQISKNYGGIYVQSFGGGNGYIGRDFRPLANFDQGILLADGAILRHVTPGLTHEPDRRPIHGLRLAGLYEAAFWSGH